MDDRKMIWQKIYTAMVEKGIIAPELIAAEAVHEFNKMFPSGNPINCNSK